MTSKKMEKFTKRLDELRRLRDGWNGYRAMSPPRDSLLNVDEFLGEIERRGLSSLLQEDDIVLTPYGTIDLDFRSDLGLVSVEIGDDGVGYFTEFRGDRENLSQEELPLGSEEIYTIIQSLK